MDCENIPAFLRGKCRPIGIHGTDDILQETVLRVLQKQQKGKFTFKDLPEPLAATCSINDMRDVARRWQAQERKHRSLACDVAEPRRPQPDVDEDLEAFDKVVTVLPRPQRDVIIMIYRDELSVAEIAEKLQRSPAAIRALRYRAETTLGEVYRRLG